MLLRVLMGQPRFSDEHDWGDLQALWPDHLEVSIVSLPAALVDGALQDGFDADIVVPFMATISAAAIAGGRFGLIQQFGVGTERIDVGAATRAGVWVANMPGLNAIPVAEHAMSLLLALFRRLPEAAGGFVEGCWGQPAGRSLHHSTACVVGLGAVGREVATRLTAFGARVIGVRRTRLPGDGPNVVGADALISAVSDADCVVVAASHSPGAAPIIDARVIAHMKPHAVLVNVARGAVIDNDAALAAIRAERIGGLGLDVFPQEPYPSDGPLLGHPRIVATAHTAALTDGYFRSAAHRLGQELQRYQRCCVPTAAINEPTFPRRRAC